MKKISIFILIIVIILGGLYLFTRPTGSPTDTAQTDTDIVATVDDQQISRAALDAYIARIKENPNFTMPTGDTADADLEKAALDDMINNMLLSADVENRQIAISDEEIDATIAHIKSQFDTEEAFKTELTASGLTEESLRPQVENQLVIEAYYQQIADEYNITVSDEEIQKFFDEQVAPQDDSVTLDSVSADIRSQIENQKVQTALADVIQKLRAAANITVSL